MQDSIFVTLSEPLEYREGGETKETDQVEIRCPTFRSVSDRRYYDHLKSMMAKITLDEARNLAAKMNNQIKDDSDEDGDDGGEEDSKKIKPNEMTYVLLSNLGDKFTDEVLAFEKHSELYCFLDGKYPLKDGALNRMHPDDKGFLFGAFMANFIYPSISRLMNGNG